MKIQGVIKDFLRYWVSLRSDGQSIPSKKAFNPFKITKLMPYLVIMDTEPQSDPLTIRVKLAGSNVYERYQKELTGTNLLDLFHEKDHQRIYAGFQSIAKQPMATWRKMITPHQRNYFLYDENMILPFYDEKLGKNILIMLTIAKELAEEAYQTIHDDGGKIDLGAEEIWIDLGFGVRNNLASQSIDEFLSI